MSDPIAVVGDFSLSLVRNGVRSEVLKHVDLQIRPGEILGLVGESGSGKSVLALGLLGLLAILVWPIIVLFRHLSFEKRRKAVLSSGDDDD